MQVEVNLSLKQLVTEVRERARHWNSCAVGERPDMQQLVKENARPFLSANVQIETHIVNGNHELYRLGMQFADKAYELMKLYDQIAAIPSMPLPEISE